MFCVLKTVISRSSCYIYCQRSAQYFYPLTTSGKRIKIILIINSLVLHVFFAPFDSAQGADNIISSTLSGVKGHGKLLKSIHLSSQIPLRSLYGATFNAFALTNYAQLLAFVFGTGCILWLAYSLYSLRAQRSRFKLELFALLAVALVAFSVLSIGLSKGFTSQTNFYTAFKELTGMASGNYR